MRLILAILAQSIMGHFCPLEKGAVVSKKSPKTGRQERTRFRVYAPRVIPAGRAYTVKRDGSLLSNYPGAARIDTNAGWMSDVVTYGYAQRVADGEIVNNPMHQGHLIVTGGVSGPIIAQGPYIGDPINECTTTFERGFWSACELSAPSPPRNAGALEWMVPLVQTKALAGVEQASIQTLVAAGEFAKTCKMLLRPLRALDAALRKAQRQYEGDLKRYGRDQMRANRARSAKERARRRNQITRGAKGPSRSAGEHVSGFGEHVSDVVLTYNLGIKPLLKDLDNLLNKIPSKEQMPMETSRAKQEERDDYEVVNTRSFYLGVASVRTKAEGFVRVRAAVRYKAQLEIAKRDFGVRLSDVPDALWELLTLSFLVDYFINVGDFLASLRALATAEFVSFSTTIELSSQKTRTFESLLPGTAYDGKPYVIKQVPLGSTEATDFWMKSRSNEVFSGQLAINRSRLEVRPPAQAQNIAGLILKRLIGLRKLA